MSRAITVQTVAELVPVAQAALAGRDHEHAVGAIRRALLRTVGQDVFGACDIAAEAIVTVAEERAEVDEGPVAGIRLAADYPGYGAELGGER